MSDLGVHWKGGRAETAPLSDGFSWDMLRPDGGFPGHGGCPRRSPMVGCERVRVRGRPLTLYSFFHPALNFI
eukprot:5606804-Alexandrium_andersonii.AAC.1